MVDYLAVRFDRNTGGDLAVLLCIQERRYAGRAGRDSNGDHCPNAGPHSNADACADTYARTYADARSYACHDVGREFSRQIHCGRSN